jgi:hypothetical protein
MTPDEFPADMEGLIERFALPWIEAEEMSVDPEDLTKAGQAVRALLKAYQEQRRALVVISKGGPDTNRPPRPRSYKDGFDEGCAWAGRIARRALNQKGDER